MISHTEENYLKALFSLTEHKEDATVNELSKLLDIKMPTVNSMMKRLADKGLVVYESYKPLKLSPLGKIEAALIIRKHRLAEMFLVEKMGFKWDEVHPIAEQMEHIQSDLLFEKMDYLLGYPATDPHGSPIPNLDGTIPAIVNTKLSDCKEGQEVIFNAVMNSSPEFLKYLTERMLTIGVKFSVQKVESFDGSIEIEMEDGRRLMLSEVASSKILVILC